MAPSRGAIMPPSTLPYSVLPQDIFPSPGLFTLFCWPFLVTWILWISARVGRARDMAFVGVGLSVIGLFGFSQGITFVEAVPLALEACVPALLFMQLRPRGEGVGCLSGAEGERLPFLVVGCIFLSFCLRSTFAVTIVVGAGSVLLAWWDGRAIRRAMPAWMMVRLRLCGVILSSLGAALLHGMPSVVTPHAAESLGVIFSVIGLAMMAGLGSAVTAASELDFLDVGLRFAALTVMLPLAQYALARQIMIFSGLIALFITMVRRERVFPLLPCFTSLGILAVAVEQQVALLLLQATALLGISLRLGIPLDYMEASTLPERAAFPALIVVLLQLGHFLPFSVLAIILGCLAIGMRGMRLSDPARHEWSFWVGHDIHTRILVGALLIVALVGVSILSWTVMLGRLG